MRRVRRWRALRISFVITVGAVLANAALYLAYRSMAPRAPSVEPKAAIPIPEPKDEEGEVARAHRLAGLRALERGEYALAYDRLLAARTAPSPSSDIDRLLALARSLRDKQARKEPAPSTPPENPPPAKAKRKLAKERSAQPAPRKRKRKAKAAPALILVTTNPPGLTVRVDGEVREPSPARVEVRAGRHAVEVLQGDKRLMRRWVLVKGGDAEHVNVDLTDSLQVGGEDEMRDRPVSSSDDSNEPEANEVSGVALGEGNTLDAARVGTTSDDAPGSSRPPAPLPPKNRIAKVPPKVLSRVVDRQGRRIRACYTAQLRRQFGMEGGLAEGRVVIRLVVSPEGAVQEGRVQKSTLDNARVDECIEEVVRELKFPPLKQVAEATFVMRFGRDK